MSGTGHGMDRHAYLAEAPLRAGDRVHLIAPAGPGKSEPVDAAVAFLEEWGLEVVVGENVLTPHPRATYLAGSDHARRDDLVRAWTDPDADAVISLCGGYGSMRLLDGLDWDQMRAGALRRDGRPKLLTGSSDITALHEAFRIRLDAPTLFCPMVGTGVFRDSAAVRADVHRWLFEPWGGRDLIGPATETMVPGAASGRLTGGNLSLLVMALGSTAVPGASGVPGGILMLEDINEDVYRLDGFLLSLARAGVLDAAAGVVLGSWHDCADLPGVRALMEEYFLSRGVPVLWEQGFGHDPEALTVPLNVDGVLEAGRDESPRFFVGQADS